MGYPSFKISTTLLALICFLLSAVPASATLITFNFSGVVIDNSLGVLFPGKSIGDSYAGSFTVDSAAIVIGPATPADSIDPMNFDVTIEGTSYIVSTVRIWSNNVADDGIEIGFTDGSNDGSLSLRSSSDIYSDASVPVSFDIADFDSLAAVSMIGIEPMEEEDSGSITTISSIPEPWSLSLVAMGLAGLSVVRRRRGAV